jgi:hypothetical protein
MWIKASRKCWRHPAIPRMTHTGRFIAESGSMRKNIHHGGHDPRSLDLAVIITLLALVVATCAVVTEVSKATIWPTTIGKTVLW